jgi:hypothetical protein
MKKNILTENMRRFGTKNLQEAGKFGRYSKYNDEPFDFRDDRSSMSTKTKPEWDAFVDTYNNIPGFETKTSSEAGKYSAEITNLESGLTWVVRNQKGNNWSYIGRNPNRTGNPEFLRDVQELIANFKQINGTNVAENMRRFGTKNLPEQSLGHKNKSALSDDDILDIIMTYTKDPDDAEVALDNYLNTGSFGDDALEANITRDPRWNLDNDNELDSDILLTIFLKYIKDVDDAEEALDSYLETGVIEPELQANLLRDKDFISLTHGNKMS